MLFGMGFGELALILCIVVVVFGATKLPQLGGGLRDSMERLREQQERMHRLHPRMRRIEPPSWSFSDWMLILSAFALGAAVVANAIWQATSGR